ncbi:MAG: type II secretion system protein GspJ [bacterium]
MKRKRAFTLIEVILATTVSAMVLAGAFATLSTLLNAYKKQEGRYSSTDMAKLILDRMRQDISSAFMSPHRDITRFVCMDQQTGDFSTDILTFISNINSTIQTGQGTTDLAEVQYYIDLDDTTPERWLVRRYDITPDDDPFTGGTIALLGPKVVSLNFEFYDGEIWYPGWDSSAQLPVAVYITIGIFQPKSIDEQPTPENVSQYSTLIWLASYRQTTSTGGLLEGEEPGAQEAEAASEEAVEAESSGSRGGGGGGGSRGRSGRGGGERGGRGGGGGNRGGRGGR